jgi:hypothetical protein
MYRKLISSVADVCPMDRDDGIGQWILDHPQLQIYNTTVDNGVHAGYEIARENVKVGEVFSPFTYAWTAIYFAPDGHRYSLINEKFEGNHPAIRAFNSLLYHMNSWGRKDMYNVDDYVWVDRRGHRFIKKVKHITAAGVVKIVGNAMDLSWSPHYDVVWDDDKKVYIQA